MNALEEAMVASCEGIKDIALVREIVGLMKHFRAKKKLACPSRNLTSSLNTGRVPTNA